MKTIFNVGGGKIKAKELVKLLEEEKRKGNMSDWEAKAIFGNKKLYDEVI